MLTEFTELLKSLPGISLDEMSTVRLMNRTDSKYLADESQLHSLLKLAQGKYMVQEKNGKRYSEYSTVYLDDTQNTMYLNHHNGRLTRQKVRIRTYLDSGDVFFEVKLKNNHGRTKKKRIQIDSADNYNCQATAEFLAGYAILPIPLSEMSPKVSNHFERITLINIAKTERLTVDTGLSFHNIDTGIDKDMNNLVVIEVKRDGNTYSPIMDILRELHIRPCGFSKYCIGSALTTPGLKRNRFISKLRTIEKLTDNKI